MRTISVVLAIVLAASGTPLVAQEAQQSSDEAPQEKKICRTEKATGSLTRRTRICMTASQWRELNDRTQRGVGDMQRSGSGAATCISAIDVSCNPSAAAPQGGIAPGSF